MNIQCSSGSTNFAKGMRALKTRSILAGHQELATTKLRAITEADPLKNAREVAEELNVKQSVVIQFLKQIGKVKKLDE